VQATLRRLFRCLLTNDTNTTEFSGDTKSKRTQEERCDRDCVTQRTAAGACLQTTAAPCDCHCDAWLKANDDYD